MDDHEIDYDYEPPDDIGLNPASDYEDEEQPVAASPDEADATRAEWQDAQEAVIQYAWDKDTSLLDAHVVMAKIFEQALKHHDTVKALRGVGLPEDILGELIEVNMETVPLIMAGLQLLGLYMPELRPSIAKTLGLFKEPTPTDEELAVIEDAYVKLADKRIDELEARLRAEFGPPPSSPTSDPGLN